MTSIFFLATLLALHPGPGEGTHACAHRGDLAAAPENTLPAIISAVEKGAHQIEFDVHMTSDGHLVIIHDATVDRTTNGSGAVADMRFEEIRALDAGSWFGPEFAGTRVPTLREVLEVIPETILCNVHLKNAPGVAAASAKVIRDMGRLSHCFLACTKKQAQEAKAVPPEIMICNMDRVRGNRAAYIDQTIALGAEFIQLHWGQGLAGLAEDIARLHDAGIRVNFFGAQEEDLIRELAEAGVDYILTDDLDLCLEVLRDYGTEPLETAAPREIHSSAQAAP